MSDTSDDNEVTEQYFGDGLEELEDNKCIEYIHTESDNTENIIYITPDESKRTEWSLDATRLFLDCFKEKRKLLDQGLVPTHKIMWTLVAEEMKSQGFDFTPAQVENRWKALKRTHRARLSSPKKQKKVFIFENDVVELLAKEEAYYPIEKRRKFNDSDENTASSSPKHELSTILSENKTTSLRDELVALKKEINNQNSNMLSMQTRSLKNQEKIVYILEKFEEKADTMLKFQSKQSKTMDELLEQTKVQNSLLQKLLERL